MLGFLVASISAANVDKEHADFKRKGADLYVERKISLVEADTKQV